MSTVENDYCFKTIHLFLSVFTRSFLSCSLQETYETKRKEFLGDLQRKEEEMRQMFVNKVKETEAELKEKEKEVSLDFKKILRYFFTLNVCWC